jgi:hypothetical protein
MALHYSCGLPIEIKMANIAKKCRWHPCETVIVRQEVDLSIRSHFEGAGGNIPGKASLRYEQVDASSV